MAIEAEQPEIQKRRAEDQGKPGFDLKKVKLEAAVRISRALENLLDDLSPEEKQALFILKNTSTAESKILGIILEIGRKLRKEDPLDFKIDVSRLVFRMLELMTKKPSLETRETEKISIEPERRDLTKDVPAEVRGAAERLKLEGPEAAVVRETDSDEFRDLVRDLAYELAKVKEAAE